MLPRTLEPEVMDSAEEARVYDAMDHGSVNRVFVADFLAVWNGRTPLLDVGTGTARIPIELCKQSPVADVLGVDMSEHMLRLGRENARRAGVELRLRLERGDAKKLPFADRLFQGVLSNSIIHHIPRPNSVFGEMVRVCGMNGTFFVRDLLRPESAERVQELVQRYAATESPRARQLFTDSLHAALTLDEVRELVVPLGFEPTTVLQTSDRHWTWHARKH